MPSLPPLPRFAAGEEYLNGRLLRSAGGAAPEWRLRALSPAEHTQGEPSAQAPNIVVNRVCHRRSMECRAACAEARAIGRCLAPGGREDVVYGDIKWRNDRIRNVLSSVRTRRTLSTPATCSLARLAGAAVLRHDSLPAALAPLHWMVSCSLINLIKTQVFFLDSTKCLPRRRRRDGPVLAAKFVIQSAIARHIAHLEDA